MAQFARPDSDVTLTSVQKQDGGLLSLFATVDESSASDSDYVYSTNNTTAEYECGLSNVTDPGSVSGTVRFRYCKTNAGTPDSGGSNSTITVRLMQGTTQINTIVWQVTASSATWATQTFTVSSTMMDSITDFTDLRLEFAILGGGGSPASRRGAGISWAEFELPDAAPPTTTLTPTPVVLDLAVAAPTMALSLALTPTPVVADLAVPASTVSIIEDVFLTPTPVVLDLAVAAPTIGLSLALAPSPVNVNLGALGATAVPGALTLAPGPVPVDLGVPAPAISLGAVTLTPTPVVVDLGTLGAALELALSLAPNPVAVDLGVLGGTLEEAGAPIFLTPEPVTISLWVPSPNMELALGLSPTPVSIALSALGGAASPGALSIAPGPVAISLGVTEPGDRVGPLIIVSGSDHQFIADCIAFYVEFDQLDLSGQRALLRQFLLTHGGREIRNWRGELEIVGAIPPVRLTPEDVD
jgi:hypothetical protein